MKNTKLLWAMFASFVLTASSAFASTAFNDLPSDHWAYKSVMNLSSKNVIKGYDDGTFQPNKTISRAEFATILVRSTGLKATAVSVSSFTDVDPSDWFSPYVEAVKETFTYGESTFEPSKPARREDVAVAIAKIKGYDISTADMSYIDRLNDKDEISAKAKDYIAVALQNGLISGYPDYTFKPNGSITRAEAAFLLWRAFGPDIKTVEDPTTTKKTFHDKDIHDLSDVQGFYGDWIPAGEGEGGRISIEFRNRTSGAITFQEETQYDTYILGVNEANGTEMDIVYVKADGSNEHKAHLKLTDSSHLTIEYENGVINNLVKKE